MLIQEKISGSDTLLKLYIAILRSVPSKWRQARDEGSRSRSASWRDFERTDRAQ